MTILYHVTCLVRYFAISLLVLLPFAPARGERAPVRRAEASMANWPVFRGGPRFDGVAPGMLDDRLRIAWTFKTGDSIKSSPVIVDGVVYIGSDDGHVYAIGMTRGEKRWAFNAGGAIEAPPLVVGGRVYVGAEDGYLYCLDASSGKVHWKYRTEGRIVGSANLVAAAKGQPASILVGSYDNSLHCVDAGSGAPRWKITTQGYVNGAAAVDNGKAVFGGCDGIIYVIALDSGEVISRINVGDPIAGTVALDDRYVYIGHYGNRFLRVDLDKSRIDWTFEEGNFPFFSSAAIGVDRVVFGSRGRRVYCVGRGDGKIRWSFTTRGRVDSSPVICGDKVAFGSEDGRLYLVKIETGEQVWSHQIGGAITGSPAVSAGRIVIGAEDGNVYAFAPTKRAGYAEDDDDR